MSIKLNRHSIYDLQYHLVVVSKYRKKIFNKEIQNKLYNIAKNIIETKNKGQIIEFNTSPNYVHILFSVGPQIQLSKLINSFKTVSSRLIRKDYKDYLDKFYSKNLFWSGFYYIGSVGDTNRDTIKNYIKNQ